MHHSYAFSFPALTAALLLLGHPAAFAQDLEWSSLELRELASGMKSLEGPAIHPVTGDLYFSDQNTGIEYIFRKDATEPEVHRDLGGKVNGHAFDAEGRLITCESAARKVTRLEEDGTYTVLASEYEGQPLNAPNDVAVHPADGSIWFTDPNYGLGQEGKDRQFVYRIDPDSLELTMVLPDNFRPDKPNGLAFSPDGKTLYLNVTSWNQVYAFDVTEAGTLKGQRVLIEKLQKWPDGLSVHPRTGDLFIALFAGGKDVNKDDQGINIFSPEGKPKGIIPAAGNTTNCAFSTNGNLLFITSGENLFGADISGMLD